VDSPSVADTVTPMTQHGSPFDPGSFNAPPPPQMGHQRGRPQMPNAPRPRKPKKDRNPRELLKGLLAAWRGASLLVKIVLPVALGIGLALGAKAVLFDTFVVPSSSMEPTLKPGDRIVAEKLSYLLGDPDRGDLVVFESGAPGWEGGPGERYYVKRVLAVAGDEVSCCDKLGRNLVNGSPRTEQYADRDANKRNKFEKVTVPEGHLFVVGDNRDDSYDSRFRGPVPANKVVGRVTFRAWPWDRVGRIGRD
jgi:signal peptidase I